MSRLKTQVRRLEREMRAHHACPVCQDRGGIEFVFADDDRQEPRKGGCGRCGKVGLRFILSVVKRPEDARESPGI